VKYTGTAFLAASFNKWDYDQKSQLTGAGRYWGSDTGDTNTPVGLQSFGYAYDNIGNRTTTLRNGNEAGYTANALNQYVLRTVPGKVDVIGKAETNATVTVNNMPVTHEGKYWHKQFTVTNSAEAVYQQINGVGVYNPPGTNDPDIVTENTGAVFVAQTPEQFTYDDDGNMLSDGRFSYSWDCENRLVSVQTLTNLPSSVPLVKVDFAYDYMSRRISKTVYDWVSNDWDEVETRQFIYDSWNVVSELITDNQSPITNHYVYGLDLSGSLQGAGGIGGLLAVVKDFDTFFPTYDGNGNVSEYLSADGEIVAHYEYDAYGNTLVADGELAQEFPHRFSTKYLDELLSLYYYGYRYYSPSLGRWLSKDPIGEKGGVHLFAFVRNNPVDRFDLFGLIDNGGAAKTKCQEVIDWKKKQGGLKTSPITGEMKGECEKQINDLIQGAGQVKDYWSKFDADKCPAPPIKCICCNEGYGGFYSPGAKDITICWNNVKQNKNLSTILIHEATHALQYCYGKGGGGCEGSLKREMEAYKCAGQCNDFASCVNRALGSSCGGHCTADEVEKLFDQMKDWFNKESKNFCTFQQTPNIPGPPSP